MKAIKFFFDPNPFYQPTAYANILTFKDFDSGKVEKITFENGADVNKIQAFIKHTCTTENVRGFFVGLILGGAIFYVSFAH